MRWHAFVFGPVCFWLSACGGTDNNETIQKNSDVVRTFFNALKRNPFLKLHQAIELLPIELKSNYALLFESRSLQEASYQYPRVILFAPSADGIFAFNGHAAQRGSNSLEMLTFDRKKNVFQLQEIVFKQGQAMEFSQINPAKCVSCHGSDPRPLWETDSFWPGAYGGKNDLEITLTNNYSQNEIDGFKRFILEAKTNPRYRQLRKIDRAFTRENASFRPRNLNLAKYLVELNSKRLARLMKADGVLEKEANQLFDILNCNQDNDATPSQIFKKFMEDKEYFIDNLLTNFGRDAKDLRLDTDSLPSTLMQELAQLSTVIKSRFDTLSVTKDRHAESINCRNIEQKTKSQDVMLSKNLRFLSIDSLSVCVSCHNSIKHSGNFDFSNKTQIQSRLSLIREYVTSGVMPPDQKISDERRVEVLRYVEASNNPW